MAEPAVFDVTAATFEADVVLRSRDVPVLLDFWAEWCGPCKALSPILEKLAAEYGGGFLLGKVDVEREQDLAYAFRVQSIPFCVLLVGGRPVDAFAGQIPEREVRAFLERAGVRPAAEAAPEADPDSPEGRLEAGLRALRSGDLSTARERLEGIGEEEPLHDRARRVLDGAAVFEAPLDGESPAAAPLREGREHLRRGDLEAAVEAFLTAVEHDRDFAGGLARKAAVLCFELMEREPSLEERVTPLRRRLATLLY